MIADAAAQGVPIGNEPAMDAWYYQQAIEAITAQPTSFFKACVLRLRRFSAITPGSTVGLPRLITNLIAVWYAVIWIGILAMTGRSIFVFCSVRKSCAAGYIVPQSSLADLWLVVLSFMLLHSVYWTDTRMRAPVMPFLCIIAAIGWQPLYHFVSRRLLSSTSN